MNVIRLPFLWERLQPTLNGPLDPAELARIDDVVTYATAKGLKVDLDVHDFGKYRGQLIGSDAVPVAAFADFWSRIASHFAANGGVLFGLMNEPQQPSAGDWLTAANAAIASIRAAGAGQEILVPGIGWDGAWTWTTGQNASVIGPGVRDPLDNYVFEVQQYLDADGSGTHAGAVSGTGGSERLAAVTSWAESTGHRLFLGEFGTASDGTSLAALGDMLSSMSRHADVWQGGTYWAAGPWWGDFMYSAEPRNGVDAAQMKVLEQYEHRAPTPAAPAATASSAAPAGASAAASSVPASDTGPEAQPASDAAEGTAPSVRITTRDDGSHAMIVEASGQTVTSSYFDTIFNRGQTGTTFAFDPGYGLDTVKRFRAGGAGHDTLDLPASGFTSIADVLHHTHDVGGSAVIVDPVWGDTIRLAGVSKAALAQNRQDFSFHP